MFKDDSPAPEAPEPLQAAENKTPQDSAFVAERVLLAASASPISPPALQPLISQGSIDVSVLFRPADFISGDLYDLRVLDENHIGIYVADASGHSVSAALLNVFLRRAIQQEAAATEGLDQPLDAAALLSRLNNDLLDLHDGECQFIAMVYAVVNTQTGSVQFARAGLPHPIIRRQHQASEIKPVAGTVTGLFHAADYEAATIELAPGDSLVIYTDGVEELMIEARKDAPADPPDQWIVHTPWYAELTADGPESAARWICVQLDEAGGLLKSKDDLTLLAITRRTAR